MFKRTGVLAAGILGLVAVATAAVPQAPSAGVRLVVMDGDRVTTETAIGEQVRTELRAAADEWQNKMTAAQQELNQLNQQLQQQQLTLSSDALAQLSARIEEKQISLQRLQDDGRRAMERLQNEGIEQVNAVLIPALEAMATEQGYDIVFDTRMVQTGGLLFYSDALDVTDEFIARINGSTTGS